MNNIVAELAVLASAERPPGFLLEPFKWAVPIVEPRRLRTLLRQQLQKASRA